MGMRKLKLESGEYQYNIGKAGVKFVGPDGIGFHKKHSEIFGWSDEQVKLVQDAGVFSVKPSILKDYLEGRKQPLVDLNKLKCESCGKADGTVKAGSDPFAAEIYNKIRHVVWCKGCYHNAAMEV